MKILFYMDMIINLSALDTALLIGLGIIVALGILVFFLAGLHRVPKDRAIVINKTGEFYCVYTKGVHFKMPIVYQRAGSYPLTPMVQKYIATNGNHLDITFQIEDVEKYHKNRITLNDLMKRIEKENSEINSTVLSDKFALYGLKFINITKSLN